ncbi:MAG: Ig-like domain-containing protein [Nitrospirae bacterium]|nr:Ig-like domain-containing protein [Nitrospirota bacterium]
MKLLRKIFFILFPILLLASGNVAWGVEGLNNVKCPQVVKIISSSPANNSKDNSIDSSIVITWDDGVMDYLTNGLRDLKPALDSINISGGRYRMGTLLTTEWGIGGNVVWDGKKEIIKPDAPLEPGTQYRLWTYLYLTLRNDKVLHCPRIGGEVVFTTEGKAPEDGNPVRNIDLSSLYNGDERGNGNISGPILSIEGSLRLITVKDQSMGKVSFVAYKEIPLMQKGEMVQIDKFKAGDMVEVTFTGGRAVMVQVNQ